MIKNLKKLRNNKGISQQQLANIIGISQQSINKYENHSVEPDITTLKNIAGYFSTSIDYLVGYTEIDHVIEDVQNYDLNDIEADFIDKFRTLSYDEKESIKLVVENYMKNKVIK